MNDRERLLESWRSEFRAAYDADPRNAALQSFEEYWRWVHTFLLTGGTGQPGWLDQVEGAVQPVSDEAAADRLRVRLHAVGKAIAAEWSKHARRRRIYSTVLQGTPNLQSWGAHLQRASAREEGDGAAIESVLVRIERDVSGALAE